MQLILLFLILSHCSLSNAANVNGDYGFDYVLSYNNPDGTGNDVDIGQNLFNNLFQSSTNHILLRECTTCGSQHQNIYYKRLTSTDSVNVYYLTTNWMSHDGSGHSNYIHTDFELYSTLSDALSGSNRWAYCNYDDFGIGMFRDCGVSGPVGHEWTSKSRAGDSARFYIYAPERVDFEYVLSYQNPDGTGDVDVGETQFNSLFQSSANHILWRECTTCGSQHKNIYYKRITNINDVNVYYLTTNWMSYDGSGHNNYIHTDFELYSTLSDALAGSNAWAYCNYNDGGIGMFRDCGASGYVGGEWTSKSRGGDKARFYIYLPEGAECSAHRHCPLDRPFCYGEDCDSCSECHYCHDGVDGTCGSCGNGYPLYESSCPTTCAAHSDCPSDNPFCYEGSCAPCSECHYCHDGIDNTCGSCGNPLYESSCIDTTKTYSGNHETDCVVRTTTGSETTVDTFGFIKGLSWSAIDLLQIMGPVGNVAAAGLHAYEAIDGLYQQTDYTVIYENIEEMFDYTVGCLKDYVDNAVWAHVEAGITNDFKSYFTDLTHTFSDYQSPHVTTTSYDEVEQDIDDLVGIFHVMDDSNYDGNTPQKCRIYMPLVTIAMNKIMTSHKVYIGSTQDPTSLQHADNYRRHAQKLLQLFRYCAPHALYDIFTDLKADLTLTDIANELDITYSDAFCGWVYSVYDWSLDGSSGGKSYQFYDSDFSEWSIDTCTKRKWTEYVIKQMMSSDYSTHILSDYHMKVSDLWNGLSANDRLTYAKKTCGCGGSFWCGYDGCNTEYGGNYYQRNDCGDPNWDVTYEYGGDLTATHSSFSWYYSTIDGHKWILSGLSVCGDAKCGDVPFSTTTNVHTCPDGSVFTGARYLVYTTGNVRNPQIGGLQLICSHPLDFEHPVYYYNDKYDTAFKHLHQGEEYSGDYEWSKYFLCPSGYYLELKLVTINGCEQQREWGSCDFCWSEYGNRYTLIADGQKVIFRCVVLETGSSNIIPNDHFYFDFYLKMILYFMVGVMVLVVCSFIGSKFIRCIVYRKVHKRYSPVKVADSEFFSESSECNATDNVSN